MISHEHRCIFIHVPKTGGSSIEHLIWTREQRTPAFLCRGFVSEFHNKYQTGGLQHLLARQVRAEVGADVFARCFKFAFVRNPWDKAVSQYAYMAQREDLRRFVGMTPRTTFKHYLSLIARRRHVQWEPQLSFLLDEDGELLVDFVGRYERLADDAQRVLRCLGLSEGVLPHENPGRRRAYPAYYDDEAREMVAEMYAEDIRWLGYRFQPAAEAADSTVGALGTVVAAAASTVRPHGASRAPR